jgi:hypothetical protein
VNRLQDIQDLPNVATLVLQKLGQPASVVGESHVQHGLESNLGKTKWVNFYSYILLSIFLGGGKIKIEIHIPTEKDREKRNIQRGKERERHTKRERER